MNDAQTADVAMNGEVSFWYADLGGVPEKRPALPGDLTADVCIVGAGYTGLWTAYYLKRKAPDLDIVIVEREFAGFGASGRNGGWLSGDFSWSRDKYAAATSRRQVIDMATALRGTVDDVIGVAEREGIDADIRRNDCVLFACSPAQSQRLKDSYDNAMAWEVPETRLSLIGAEEARARIGIANAAGALVTHGTARVQPAKLVRGLAAVVERMGVRIYEGTTVTRIEKGRVTTDRGVVRADKIVRATEGFTHGIPGNEREWIPMNSAIVVTEPLPDELWKQIGWDGYDLLSDVSHGYSYAQRTRENRIAMGGRGVPYRFGSRTDDRGRTQAATIAQLQEILYRLLPQVRGYALDHAWCGVLGVPRDWCTSVGMDPATGIGWAGGYVGTGVSTSNLAGQTLADLILGLDTPLTHLAWVNRRPRKWEPEPLRWLGVHAMYQLYHIADRRERGSGGTKTSALAKVANRITGR